MSVVRNLKTCLTVLGMGLFLTHDARAQTTHPHVLMIFTDDMGYADISSFSNALPAAAPDTVNIDRLAEGGKSLTQFYVASPICSPSRAAVLSGMFSPETRITTYLQARTGNDTSDQNDWMDPALSYFPKSFQAAGYATGHVGKWHLGGGRDVDNAPSISEYGYDEFYSTWESPNPDFYLGVEHAPWDASRRVSPGQVIRHRRTEYMVDRTLDFFQRHAGEPCFVTLWADDLHTPYWPSPEMLAKYNGDPAGDTNIENFYGILEEYDRQIGRLMDGLEALGVEDDTIVIFTGDNGPNPTYTGGLRSAGMRGSKTSLYEGGTRQPFIIRWPGQIPANVVDSDTIMGAVDLLPTLTALAGIDMVDGAEQQLDGIDLSAALTGAPMARSKPLMWEFGPTRTYPRLAIRDGDFKLHVESNGANKQLYNIRLDPFEANNLITNSQYTTMANAMEQQVRAWSSSLPHRTHPFPAFAAVDYNRYAIDAVATAAQLQAAAGSINAGRITGITVDPNDDGDIFIMYEGDGGVESFLRIDPTSGEIDKITDSVQIAADIGIAGVAPDMVPTGGFAYSPPGNSLYVADSAFSSIGQITLIGIEAGTGTARIVTDENLTGLNDLDVMLHGNIGVVRGAGSGASVMGTVQYFTGAWSQQLTESALIAAAPGTTNLPMQSMGVNDSGGEAFIFSAGDGDLFEIGSPQTASPVITRQTHYALNSIDLQDVELDQAGNMYGLNSTAENLVIVSSDGTVLLLPYSAIENRIGSAFSPEPRGGVAARMLGAQHADVFLANTSGDSSVVRVRFGPPRASVSDWTLY